MTTTQQITRIIHNRIAQGFSPRAIAYQLEKALEQLGDVQPITVDISDEVYEMLQKSEIFDTREYYDPNLNATIRANILGGGIDENGVYLVVQPTAALYSQQWTEMPTDDTAFKEAADVVMGEAKS